MDLAGHNRTSERHGYQSFRSARCRTAPTLDKASLDNQSLMSMESQCETSSDISFPDLEIMKLSSVIDFLEIFAPPHLAEDWDNVGLLLGDRASDCRSLMTCLTITPDVVEEAVDGSVDLIVAHHPLPFHPLKKITADTVVGSMILKMAKANIAVYSPHTAFDSTANGINQSIAEKLNLEEITAIQIIDGNSPDLSNDIQQSKTDNNLTVPNGVFGVGRMGRLVTPTTCIEICENLKVLFDLKLVQFCGELDAVVTKIGIACGSAGQFLNDAKQMGCDAFITGETNFHTCLESIANRTPMFLLGHYGSERFAVELLAKVLSEEFPQIPIWPSQNESDPIQNVL